MSTLQFIVSVKQDGAVIISQATETVSVPGAVVGTGASGVLVAPGTYNQLFTCSILYAKLQSLYATASQAMTVTINGTNAVQSITLGGGATGGTFTITYSAITSAGIAWNATAATVQAALQAMASIGAGNCTVTGSAGGPWTVTFVGALGVAVITTITGSASGLTGGTPTITLASVTAGVAATALWALAAGSVIPWANQDGFYTNPLGSTDVTTFNITNAGTAAGTFTLIAGSNA